MMKRLTAGLVAVTWLFGTLACAGGSANEDDTAAAPQQDTAQATEPPPGYSGMERDTTGAEHQPTVTPFARYELVCESALTRTRLTADEHDGTSG